MVDQRVIDVIGQHLERDVVGLAIAVVEGDELRWSQGFGRLDVDRPDPVTPRTVFSIQSVTKPIVATALMQSVERGVVGLDDPVNRHLGAVQVANEWEHDSPVTIRQLLTHTAGLPVSVGLASRDSLEAVIAHEVHTEVEPGTRMLYANWGYDVLGYLVARLAGTAWDVAVRDAVLDPLGMSATEAAPPAIATDSAAATGHVISQLDGTYLRLAPSSWPYYPGAPSGALVSDIEDLARFVSAHLTGHQNVLARTTIGDMQRLHAPLGDGGGGMGLGFRVDRRADRAFFCHVGDGAGFSTFIGGYPDERVGMVLLINVGGADAARAAITRAVFDTVVGGAAPRATRRPPATRPVPGRYRATDWGLRAEVTDDDGVPLVILASNLTSSPESTSRLTETGGRWRADGGRFDGSELDFDAAAGGRHFVGGLYPMEFVADDSQPVALPTAVDETGDLTGSWAGPIETPVGVMPIELVVAAGRVTVSVFGIDAADDAAETGNGWVHARFELDIVGVGPLAMVAQLGLVGSRLEGILVARHSAGELSIAAVLEHPAETA